MSRLDSAIRRLEAQRACLDRAAELVAGQPGPVLELGLGNGRSYDHLRERLPGREIFVLDRQVAAHPDCIPDAGHMILGDFRDTVPGLSARLPAAAVLVHCDIGSGDAAATRSLAAFVSPYVAEALAAGGVLASDQALSDPTLQPLPLPEAVPRERYFLYRKAAVGDA